jgi:hypothetical protein
MAHEDFKGTKPVAHWQNKAGVRGFGHKDKESPAAERGWLGHEGEFAQEGDVYGDHDHMMVHREMHKDGSIHAGQEHGRPSHFNSKSASESGQAVDPMEMRFKHKEHNAGVLLGARGSDEEVHHGAQNRYMDRAASTGAKRVWKPKGRAAAEHASKEFGGKHPD